MMEIGIRKVKCPRCSMLTEWSSANPYRPFCSKRCKNIDLGAWADEDYRVTMIDQEDFLLELQQVE